MGLSSVTYKIRALDIQSISITHSVVPLGKYFKEINALLKYEMEDKE